MLAKSKIAGLMVAAMALSAALVYADNGPGPGPAGDGKTCPVSSNGHQGGNWHRGHGDHMLAKILNLTEDQVNQLKLIKEQDKVAMKAIFAQMRTIKGSFEAEIVKATPDMAKINDLQAQMKTIQGQMLDNHLNSILAIKKIMTPEQFAGFMALKKERMMKKHMMGHGKFGHRDGFDKDHDGDRGHYSEGQD